MNPLIETIHELSAKYYPEVVHFRRHLHANPELSFKEYETASFIKTELQKFGFPEPKNFVETGFCYLLEGDKKGETIALRADMDALPITEMNDVPYKSKTPGVMHACGHDVHSACLMGAMMILNELQHEVNGAIKFIFQPGEEKIPGGASLMIKEGVLENPKPNKILGQHVMPLIDVGQVGFRSGMYMASADEIYFKVVGKGGHAAMPETLIDPILVTSHIILGLQQIVSRRSSPKIPSVLSFGDIQGHGATNVIPDEVNVQGTFRTFDENWRSEAHELMKKIATGIAESMGAQCYFNIKKGYPHLINEAAYTHRSRQAAEAYLGSENVLDLDLWLAAEDFAFYSHHVDACFYRLGIRNESKQISSSVHTATFDIDEEALKIGMGLMAWLALQELQYLSR